MVCRLLESMSSTPTTSLSVCLLLLLAFTGAVQSENNEVKSRDLSAEDIPDYEVFNMPSHQVGLLRSSKQSQQGTPCTCNIGQCTCCTGPILDFFSQKACMKVLYTPEDFSFDLTMLLNNRTMYKNKLSGKNPPPACIRVPRLTSLKLCAKFSNIYFAGRNLHMCMGMEGLWDYYELFSFSFDCIRFGSEGVAVVKPEEGGGLPGVNGGLDAVIDSGDDIEDYDENVVRATS